VRKLPPMTSKVKVPMAVGKVKSKKAELRNSKK
jgi:hypothetical protein